MSLPPRALHAVPVENVALTETNLTFTHAGTSDKVPLHEVVFILKSSSPEYLICCLKEDAENNSEPYRLSVLQAASIPAQAEQYLIKHLPSYLAHADNNQVDVIVSTKSGTGLAVKVWEEILQPLWDLVASHLAPEQEANHHVTLTESSETIREFAKTLFASAAQNPRPRTVVLLSGDGGIVDLLNGSSSDTPPDPLPLVALLPLGTGNALFHSTHKPLYLSSISSPLTHALRTLFHGTPSPLPVFRASFPPGSRIVTFTDPSSSSSSSQPVGTPVSHLDGAIVASYGFHASVVHESDTPAHRVHGAKRFGIVAAELLAGSHPYAAEVSIRRPGSSSSSGWETIPRNTHAYVLATLVSNLERTFTISPASQPLQGRLRLVHFGPVGGERTMEVMMKAYDEGKHVGVEWDDGEKVGYDEVDEVSVVVREDDARWRNVCVDGTIVEVPKGEEMRVRVLERGPLRILADGRVI